MRARLFRLAERDAVELDGVTCLDCFDRWEFDRKWNRRKRIVDVLSLLSVVVWCAYCAWTWNDQEVRERIIETAAVIHGVAMGVVQ